MPASSADFINFLARIRKMLGDAPTMSNERKINAQTPNDASTYCRGRGICCRGFAGPRAIDNRQSELGSLSSISKPALSRYMTNQCG